RIVFYVHQTLIVKHPGNTMVPSSFVYLNPYRILCASNLDDFDCVPLTWHPFQAAPWGRLGLMSSDDDEEQAKFQCHSGFRETPWNFTYLCWVLPIIARTDLAESWGHG